jgi:hypothetical protein
MIFVLSFFFVLQTVFFITFAFCCVLSNADRASWWELTLLASHVHPSVFTMARTLLSGNNIVYNGDPLTDLSLPAFLDKFMEKKPKGNRIAEGKWHGGSQIAPAKKVWIFSLYFLLLNSNCAFVSHFCVIFSYVCHGSHVASLIGDDVLVLLLCLGHVSDNARMCHGQ